MVSGGLLGATLSFSGQWFRSELSIFELAFWLSLQVMPDGEMRASLAAKQNTSKGATFNEIEKIWLLVTLSSLACFRSCPCRSSLPGP